MNKIQILIIFSIVLSAIAPYALIAQQPDTHQKKNVDTAVIVVEQQSISTDKLANTEIDNVVVEDKELQRTIILANGDTTLFIEDSE